MPEVVGVQFLKGGGVAYYQPLDKRLATGTVCVVEAEHGLHAARVVHPGLQLPERVVSANLPKILRVATPRDQDLLKANERKEREAYRLCRKKVKDKSLAMKLVDVTYTLDGRKAVFYFTAENRIDFRELVKELAQALKIKIEMRQIGVRDETRRLGGVGCCGRSLCCCTFLRDFVSVSIRMAKDQNLSLNPTKVSGLCGRLMCCLAYEYEGPSKDKKKKRDEKPMEAAELAALTTPGADPQNPVPAKPDLARPVRPEGAAWRPDRGERRPGSPSQPGAAAPGQSPRPPEGRFGRRKHRHRKFPGRGNGGPSPQPPQPGSKRQVPQG